MNLQDYKQDQEVVLSSRDGKQSMHGTIHNVFDEELGRLEVHEPFNNSIIMITPDDPFWEIKAGRDDHEYDLPA